MQPIILTDPVTSEVAKILPQQGFNLFSWVTTLGGQPWDVLWAEEGYESATKRASSSGNPILFPFPGRIPGTLFRWLGKEYTIPAGDNRGNAIHGFVHTRPWKVVAHSANSCTAEFSAFADAPELRAMWPTDFLIRAEVTLANRNLSLNYTCQNIGEAALPCGLGIHPYFRIPAAGATVSLPVSKEWELKEMLPTGQEVPLARAAEYQTGAPFDSLQLDNVLSGLIEKSGEYVSSIAYPTGERLSIAFGKPYRELVVYTPGHRQAICIEPYTCVPGGITSGEADRFGVKILSPGESFAAHTQLVWQAEQ